MRKRKTIGVFILLVFIVPVTAWALWDLYERKMGSLPVMGRSSDHRIEDFKLINQEGESRTAAAWENRIVVVDFFFTHCPVICPQMTGNLKKLSAAFERDEALLINSFSVDPGRDSVARLKAYASRFGIRAANWDLLTGDKKDIYKLARNSFMLVATDGDGGPDDFIHSEKLVLVDRQRRIRGYYDGTSDKETRQLITDIKKLKDEK